MAHGTTDCLRGHFINAKLFRDDFWNLAVSDCFSKWNAEQDVPYSFAKRRRVHRQRRRKVRGSSVKVNIEPFLCFIKYGQSFFFMHFWQRISKVFLPIEPKPCNFYSVTRNCNSTQRRAVMINIFHIILPLNKYLNRMVHVLYLSLCKYAAE